MYYGFIKGNVYFLFPSVFSLALCGGPNTEGLQVLIEIRGIPKCPASQQSTSICLTSQYTRVGTLIVTTIYLQLIQNRYMFRSFTVLQCSHQYCVQPVASDVEVVGYL